MTTASTTVAVATGATVTNTGAPAIAVDVPHTGYSSTSDTITVAGSVSAPGQGAITTTSGASYGSYNGSQSLTLTVAAGGSVTGSIALSLLQSAGNTTGTVTASVDNAGTLTGTSGVALSGNAVSTANGYATPIASFPTITNRAGGVISGEILGPVTTLNNAGSIDGGTNAAVSSNNQPFLNALTVNNTGTIRSTGAAALNVTSNALTLTNAGTITGNVVVTGSTGSSTINSTAGTINGNLTLGAANDTLIARYVGTPTLATGITGTVDGGGGTNTEQIIFASNTTITTAVALASNFQRLALAPASNVTVTLGQGFSTGTGLVLAGGNGSVVNQGTITAIGQPAVTDLYLSSGVASFNNAGTISTTGTIATTGPNGYAVSLTFTPAFANSGTIISSGGGVTSSDYMVANSGTITAVGTGVNGFDTNIINTGLVTSTSGAGVVVGGSSGYVSSNAGTIRGQTAGVETSIIYTNTGLISSPARA